MFDKLRHRLMSSVFGGIRQLFPVLRRHFSASSALIASGVFGAMLIGGVFGWVGATLYKGDPPPVAAVQTPTSEYFTEQTLDALGKAPTKQTVQKQPEVAALPPQTDIPEEFLPQDPPAPALARWQKNAIPFQPQPNVPMIAIIIDDMGVDQRRTAEVFKLPGPLTGSFLSYARNLHEQVQSAHAAGLELMLHMPMEPMGSGYDPGPDVLLASMTENEIRQRLQQSLASFDGYVGINNHMGSKFTSCGNCMKVVSKELKSSELIFIDSLTSGKSVAAKMAEAAQVPNLTRDVFLDDSPKSADIAHQLKRLENIARKSGHAIAIGHPRDTTIKALQQWIPSLKDKGIQLVPVSTLVKVKYGIL